MESHNLPQYKKTFLNEMEQLRQNQQIQQPSYIQQPQQHRLPQNNILNTSQYSQPLWKNQLNQTTNQRNHDTSHHNLNLLMNPQINRKKHNINITQISEYSNAMHNNTVFVNPKHTSC